VTKSRDAHPRELLSAYLDGELTETERTGVGAHVAGCSFCGALLDDFRAMAATATREEAPPVPADLRSRIRLKIGTGGVARTPPSRHRLEYYRLGLAAAAGIVLAIGLWATRWEYVPPPTSPIEGSAAPDAIAESDRAKAEREPLAQPGAPAESGDDASLRALGYIGNGSEPKENAAPATTGRPPVSPAPAIVGEVRDRERPEKRRAIEANDLAAPSTGTGSSPAAAGTVAGASGSRQDVAEDQKGGARTQSAVPLVAPRSAAIGGPGQVLVFEYTGYRVTAQQDGTVVLSTQGYTCSVREDGPSVDPDIASLFVLAASDGEMTGAPALAQRGATVVRLLKPQSAQEEAAGEAPGSVLPGAKGIAVETRLRTLLRGKYLPLMESRCGTVPRVVGSP